MKRRQWYRARIRWAEMVEGRGIRNWEEGLVSVSQRRPRGGVPAGLGDRRRRAKRRGRREPAVARDGWRPGLAEVVTLDCLGD